MSANSGRQTGQGGWAKTLARRVALPPATRQILAVGGILLVAFLAIRVIFYAMHGDKASDPSATTLIWSFLIGIRFDLAALAVLLFFLAFLSHLPMFCGRERVLKNVFLTLLMLFCIAATLTAIGDCIYYEWSAKRISYEPLVMMVIGFELLEFSFGEYPVLLPALLLGFTAFWVVIWRKLRRSCEIKEGDRAWIRTRSASWGLLLLFGLFVLFRGSLGSPLRIGDGYFSNDVLVNHATLNPIHTFLISTWDERHRYDLMEEARAVDTVRASVLRPGGEQDEYLSDEFPLLRRTRHPGEPRKYNVVILLMESLSAPTMGAFGDPNQATPEMDRLIEESVLFDRFIASGSRSSNGLIATLMSVPAQLGRPVTHTAMMLDNFRSLASILCEQGYESTFLYGGVYDFRNADGFIRNAGYQKLIGEPEDDKIKRRAWGYDDQHMFDRLLHELETRTDRPQFMTLFTQSLHGREVPKKYVEMRGGLKFPKSMKHDRYYNLLDYTDWCVGRFFKKARRLPAYSDTIFVITSDHTNHKNPNLFQNRHIPLIIHAPRLLEPARYTTTGGQCDVLPTVLGMLGMTADHVAFGQDLLAAARQGAQGQAYFTYGESIGWAEGPWIIQDFFDSDLIRLYNLDDDPKTKINLAHDRPDLARQMSDKARATLQLSRQLLFENRIYPPHTSRQIAAPAESEKIESQAGG